MPAQFGIRRRIIHSEQDRQNNLDPKWLARLATRNPARHFADKTYCFLIAAIAKAVYHRYGRYLSILIDDERNQYPTPGFSRPGRWWILLVFYQVIAYGRKTARKFGWAFNYDVNFLVKGSMVLCVAANRRQ